MDFIGDILATPIICFGWIIVGAIAGSLARSIMRSKNRSFLSDVILGIAGAFIGGFLAAIVGVAPDPDTSGLSLVLANLVIATIGASVLIAGWRTIS